MNSQRSTITCLYLQYLISSFKNDAEIARCCSFLETHWKKVRDAAGGGLGRRGVGAGCATKIFGIPRELLFGEYEIVRDSLRKWSDLNAGAAYWDRWGQVANVMLDSVTNVRM